MESDWGCYVTSSMSVYSFIFFNGSLCFFIKKILLVIEKKKIRYMWKTLVQGEKIMIEAALIIF